MILLTFKITPRPRERAIQIRDLHDFVQLRVAVHPVVSVLPALGRRPEARLCPIEFEVASSRIVNRHIFEGAKRTQ